MCVSTCVCVHISVILEMLSCRASAKKKKTEKGLFFAFSVVFLGEICRSLGWVGYCILFWFQIGQRNLQSDIWREQL